KAQAAETPLQQLGDYQILREVGRGGMGVVYEAQQLSLGRHVAIKVLPPHALLDPRQLGRFPRGARAAARRHPPNIVPVFGVASKTASTTTSCSSSRGSAWTRSWTNCGACGSPEENKRRPRAMRRAVRPTSLKMSPRWPWPAVYSRGYSARPSRPGIARA